MSQCRSIDEALATVGKATTLSLDCADVTDIPDSIGDLEGLEALELLNVHENLGIPATLRELSKLRRLSVRGPRDCSVRFPSGLF